MATAKLTSNDISEIAFQDDVDSYPLRTNFNNLKNAINGVVDDIAAASIGTTNAETTAARPYHTSLNSRLDSMWKGQSNYIKYGGVVSINGSDAQKVDVTACEAKVDGVDVKADAATSGTIAYTVANTRYDVVVINSDSTFSVVTGLAAASPVFPQVATSQKSLAILLVTTAAVSIYKFTTSTGDYNIFDGVGGNSNMIQGKTRKQIFMVSGTWTKPAHVSMVSVLCVGAGGAGGVATASGYAGGGGGAGAVKHGFISVTGDVSVTVGATGNTTFSTITSNAGANGSNGTGAAGGAGGAGGGAGAGGGGGGASGANDGGSGGTYKTAGSNGGGTGGTGGATSGDGGALFFAGGAGGVNGGVVAGGGGGAAGYGGDGGKGGGSDNSGNGQNAGGIGSGGGGAGGNTSYTAGSGGNGLCIVEWEE